jgi:hypothetical protein
VGKLAARIALLSARFIRRGFFVALSEVAVLPIWCLLYKLFYSDDNGNKTLAVPC